MNKKIVALITILIWAMPVVAQSEWQLSREGSGIKVYTRKEGNAAFKSVKVECNFTGSIDKLIAILKTVDGNKKWVYNTKQTHTVKNISGNEFIYYAETSLPWPLRNRDVVINMLFDNDSLHKTLTVKATGVQGHVDQQEGIVRIPYFNGLWQVAATGDTHISIHYILSVDPGGSIPAWAYNKFVAKGPYKTFLNLSELLMAP